MHLGDGASFINLPTTPEFGNYLAVDSEGAGPRRLSFQLSLYGQYRQ
jgi:hypothetical protein